MSYDHYVPSVAPALHKRIMNNEICIKFVFCSWLCRFFVIFPPLFLGLNLDFCASNTVDHFCCDNSPPADLLRHRDLWDDGTYLSFGDTCGHIDNIIYLYHKNNSKIPPNNQRKSFFNMLLPHMVVITLYYGSCIFIYKPSVKQRASFSKGIAVLQYLCCTTFWTLLSTLYRTNKWKTPLWIWYIFFSKKWIGYCIMHKEKQ